MADNIIKNDHQPNFSSISQHNEASNAITRNMSVVPQQPSRPGTLQINRQLANNLSLFTPNDYNKFVLSTPEMDDRLREITTPDLINAMTAQPTNNEQSSPGAEIVDELLRSHEDSNNRSMLSTMNPLVHTMPNVIPHNNNNQKQEHVSTYRQHRSNYQALSRNRSISSSMNDNDSSNSTTPSSPMTTDMHSNNGKDELQHVPSIRSKYSDNPPDEVVRKEKKRERNRQAAQKCRTRKLRRIDELQKRVNELQNKNKDLSGVADCLKTDITRLERQLQDHHAQGCTLMNGSI